MWSNSSTTLFTGMSKTPSLFFISYNWTSGT
jgi:hypothetical protein